MDLATAGRQLRAQADQNILPPYTPGMSPKRGPEVKIDLGGQTFIVSLSRMGLDERVSTYVVFIMSNLPASNQACEKICRSIYDVKWREGPLKIPGLRWFIRARVEDSPSV